MAVEHNGVLLINPGAITSGSLLARQTIQTVAHLRLNPGEPPQVEHIDIQTRQRYVPTIDLAAGFRAAAMPYSESIGDDEVQRELPWLRETLYPAAPDFIVRCALPLAHECWDGSRDRITARDLVLAFTSPSDAPAIVVQLLRDSPVFGRYVG